MKITDLFKQESIRADRAQTAGERAGKAGREEALPAAKSPDSIQISNTARLLSRASQILADDEEARAKRISELKEQVQSGEYSVSSLDVAEALISYARDSSGTDTN